MRRRKLGFGGTVANFNFPAVLGSQTAGAVDGEFEIFHRRVRPCSGANRPGGHRSRAWNRLGHPSGQFAVVRYTVGGLADLINAGSFRSIG